MAFIKKIKRKLNRFRFFKYPKIDETVQPRLPQIYHSIQAIVLGKNLATLLNKIRDNSDRFFTDFHSDLRVLIKINLNSPFPYPASTSPEILVGIIDILRERGVDNITVGDCTSNQFLPTKNVMRDTGLTKLLLNKAILTAFERKKWVRTIVDGRFLKDIVVSKNVYEADRIINLSNLKTHFLADFSLGAKNMVGITHPVERRGLHDEHLQEKIAELALAVQPDLTIIDARKIFICGGPNEGEICEGERVFIGNNWLSTDLEAYKFLYSMKAVHNCLGSFTEDPFDMRQFACYQREKKTINSGGGWQII